MTGESENSARTGARQMAGVPADVLAGLAAGELETVNLMEWLAADMPALARAIAAKSQCKALGAALIEASEEMAGRGVTQRLKAAGRAIASSTPPPSEEFCLLAVHKSDLVRQWACYAVNHSSLSRSLEQRLLETLPFAADRNMSVRETAWMAFRPHLAESFEHAFPLVQELARNADENIRRFAVEVTRPRSVWGAHLPVLKSDPGRAIKLLERVKGDPSRYVRLAVGNWLNDASKTRPDWTIELSSSWRRDNNPHTHSILKRGLRTIVQREQHVSPEPTLPLGIARLTTNGPMENVI